MPELPDLEIFRQNLMKIAINKVIKHTGVNATKALIGGTESDLKQLTEGKKFTDIGRRGKHLIFNLSNNSALIIHLMLRGKFVYTESQTDHELSDCFWFQFEDENELKVVDRTRWVKLEICKPELKIVDCRLLSSLGPEADEISLEEFSQILKKSRLGRIKPLLMDQKKIAGIGNAYADEILWKSKINPNKTASLLSDDEIETLHSNIKKVLEWGIEENKKELGDKLVESKRSWMNVYRKEGKPCPVCGTKIKHTKVNQRDTFYCEKCQKD
jgi:formamidopyrimidine-DNA glycosylase